jgi:hypothetical protein
MTVEIPRELVEQFARGNGVVFVGSSLSRGAGLPDWGELLKTLADSLDLPQHLRNSWPKFVLSEPRLPQSVNPTSDYLLTVIGVVNMLVTCLSMSGIRPYTFEISWSS